MLTLLVGSRKDGEPRLQLHRTSPNEKTLVTLANHRGPSIHCWHYILGKWNCALLTIFFSVAYTCFPSSKLYFGVWSSVLATNLDELRRADMTGLYYSSQSSISTSYDYRISSEQLTTFPEMLNLQILWIPFEKLCCGLNLWNKRERLLNLHIIDAYFTSLYILTSNVILHICYN